MVGPVHTENLSLENTIFIGAECIVSALILIGNLLVVIAYLSEHYIQTVTNFYVFSMAITDLLVGIIGIPVFLYSMVTELPGHFQSCLFVYTWIMMLCTISILHLLAVSFDRYLIIVHNRSSRDSSRKHMTICLIAFAWIFGTFIGLLPMMGWNRGPPIISRCRFLEVIDLNYLVFLYYTTIIAPTLLMIFFYVQIYHTITRQGISLKIIEKYRHRQQVRRRKVATSLAVVIIVFLLCWYPLYTMNAIVYYYPKTQISTSTFYIAIVMSHLSSATNPLIYSYTMPGFKLAFRRILLCDTAHLNTNSFSTRTGHGLHFSESIRRLRRPSIRIAAAIHDHAQVCKGVCEITDKQLNRNSENVVNL